MRNSRLAGGLAALAVLLVLLVSAPAVFAAVPAPNPGAAKIAHGYLGVPYADGGISKKGVSTAGLTKLVYRRMGIWLPWDLAVQARRGAAITREALRRGDLVFDAAREHAGVYTGNGKVITMPGPGALVSSVSMDDWGADLAFRRYNANTGYHAALLAKHFLGVPYVFGGASPSGFDASGLTMYVYAQLGTALDHGATDQQRAAKPIPVRKLRRGDLVFFGSVKYSHHVGIYMGNGRMIDALHTGTVVRFDPISGAWIGGRFLPVR
jgi:cell wall-associated NlpC family hydrolase